MIKFIKMMLVVALIAMTVVPAMAAKNYVKDGEVITLNFATTSPVSGAPIVKGTASGSGAIIGVAINGTGVAAENVSVMTRGIFKCPMTLAPGAGVVKVGDFVYTTMGGIDVCTVSLATSTSASSILFGTAVEALSASTTATVVGTVTIMLQQPKPISTGTQLP